MEKAEIGLYGMGVMGRNLALNIESKGYPVAVYNITAPETKAFVEGEAKGKNILPTYSLADFVASLKKPAKVWLMVTAGSPVDECIQQLLPFLNKGDLIIDGGNSFFKDTMRRSQALAEKGILFLGIGVSGGEEGALKGPSLMPGGQPEAYHLVAEILQKIAAVGPDGKPCVAYIGPNGAGHFVKMVHNGIEYADMELIGECAWFFREALALSPDAIADIFAEWNQPESPLRSYLISITAEVLRAKDKETGLFLVDRTADITRMKGTGTWTVQSALELLVPIPTIAAAVFCREASQEKDLRLELSRSFSFSGEHITAGKNEYTALAQDALYLAKIASYAQGLALLQAADREYQFHLNLAEIAKIWRAGCIIRAQFLDEIATAYQANPALVNLLAAPRFTEFVNKNMPRMVRFIQAAYTAGIPILALSSSYHYIRQLVSPVHFAAQVAALQRDYFGAHGYFKLSGPQEPQVLIRPDGKVREFHTDWLSPTRPEKEITK